MIAAYKSALRLLKSSISSEVGKINIVSVHYIFYAPTYNPILTARYEGYYFGKDKGKALSSGLFVDT